MNLEEVEDWVKSGWVLGHMVKSWKNLVYTLKGTILIQSS